MTRWWPSVRNGGLLLAAWWFALFAARAGLTWRLATWLATSLTGSYDPLAYMSLQRFLYGIGTQLSVGYALALFVTTFALPLGFLARRLAAAKVRSGAPDPLAKLRGFVAAHPIATAALQIAPGALWALFIDAAFQRPAGIEALIPAGISTLAHFYLARAGTRGLVAPTGDAPETTNADGFTFEAVAVTRETIGTVGALAAMAVAMLVTALSLPVPQLVHGPFVYALLAYVAISAGAAVGFQRASRISVGLDGVLIGGSSRRRFVPFRDVDGARANGPNLELTRGDRAVLRLQLHGDHAWHRDALLERFRSAIAHAAARREDPAAHFVASASSADLERAAGGASSYRAAAPTREKLWELVESPAIDSAARQNAAAALAKDIDEGERIRLRIAASHVADPKTRVRIEELLEEAEAETAPVPARRLTAP